MRNIVELAGSQPCPLQTVGRPSDLVAWERAVTSTGLLQLKREWTVYCVMAVQRRCRIQTKCQKCYAELCRLYQDVSKIITQGTVVGSKLQQWVIREDFQAQRSSADKVCNNSYMKQYIPNYTSCAFFLGCATCHSCMEYLGVNAAGSF